MEARRPEVGEAQTEVSAVGMEKGGRVLSGVELT